MSRVLVIDDSPMLVELTVRALSAAGYHATGATDLASLEVKLSEGPFSLILMDVNMPEMFGDDVVEYLRTQKKVTSKLVLYSDISEEELAAKTRQSGADAYILKGGGLEAVIGGIMRILGAPPVGTASARPPAPAARPGAPAAPRPVAGAPTARAPAPAARPLGTLGAGQAGASPGTAPRPATAAPRPSLTGQPTAPRPATGSAPPTAPPPRTAVGGPPPATRPAPSAPAPAATAPRAPGTGQATPPRAATPVQAPSVGVPAPSPTRPAPTAPRAAAPAPTGGVPAPTRPAAAPTAPPPRAALTPTAQVPTEARPPQSAPAPQAPAAAPEPAPTPTPATPPAPAATGGFPSAAKMAAAAGRKPRILIVDDSEMTARIIEADLVSKGFEVHIADSADKATKIILKKQTRPDLVLLDVRMPNVNGEQFCRFIKSNSLFKGIKVLLCSGENVEELQRICREAGADGYVPKDAVLGNLVAKELNPVAPGAE